MPVQFTASVLVYIQSQCRGVVCFPCIFYFKIRSIYVLIIQCFLSMSVKLELCDNFSFHFTVRPRRKRQGHKCSTSQSDQTERGKHMNVPLHKQVKQKEARTGMFKITIKPCRKRQGARPLNSTRVCDMNAQHHNKTKQKDAARTQMCFFVRANAQLPHRPHSDGRRRHSFSGCWKAGLKKCCASGR